MKLWDKGFTINDKIEKFTVGKDRELDAHLAKYDALASKAQAWACSAVKPESSRVSVAASGVVNPVSVMRSGNPAPSVPMIAQWRGCARAIHWLIVVFPLVPVIAINDMRSLGCP